jgi:hypothetical protein
MLHRALGKILPLGDALRLVPLFDDGAIDSAQTEFHRERDTDGSAADDDDLMPFFHSRAGALKKTP